MLRREVLVAMVLMAVATAACAKPPPKSIADLRALERQVELKFERNISGGPGFSASLYSDQSGGLNVHAMVARPDQPTPESGFSVVIFNHGHHPEPRKYGITADGVDHRPGDYYRKIPELFV